MGGKYEVRAWNEPFEIGVDAEYSRFTDSWWEMRWIVRKLKKSYDRVLVIVRIDCK